MLPCTSKKFIFDAGINTTEGYREVDVSCSLIVEVSILLGSRVHMNLVGGWCPPQQSLQGSEGGGSKIFQIKEKTSWRVPPPQIMRRKKAKRLLTKLLIMILVAHLPNTCDGFVR